MTAIFRIATQCQLAAWLSDTVAISMPDTKVVSAYKRIPSIGLMLRNKTSV